MQIVGLLVICFDAVVVDVEKYFPFLDWPPPDKKWSKRIIVQWCSVARYTCMSHDVVSVVSPFVMTCQRRSFLCKLRPSEQALTHSTQ